ncbi:MAG: type II secretion system protein GspK [Polyangiaceae bacterium]
MTLPATFRHAPALARAARRRRARRRNRRGIAFIMVLGALTILTVMLTELQDESSAEFSSALEARDALVAEYAAKSAVNLSRLLIASEPTVRTALSPLLMMVYGQPPQLPVWRFADKMLGPFNDKSGGQDFSSFSGMDLALGKNLGFAGASFEVKIIDEDSKINLNSASRGSSFGQQQLMRLLMSMMAGAQYSPMFERRDTDGNFSDRQAICAAMIDWVDPDQDTMLCDPTNNNAQSMPPEDSYYQNLKKPYQRKNAPFDSLEELRKVRGVTDDFWGTFVDPDPEKPEKRLLSVWGQSNQININTADPQTLLVLICNFAPMAKVCTDPAEMQKFLMITMMLTSFTMGAPPFGSANMFLDLIQGKGKGILAPLLLAVGLEPVVIPSVGVAKDMIATSSKVFSIYATGIVKTGKRESRVRIHTVVDFRNAPPPGAATTGPGAQPGSTPGATPTPQLNRSAAASAANAAATAQQTAIAALTRPNPAGNVVYFKMD